MQMTDSFKLIKIKVDQEEPQSNKAGQKSTQLLVKFIISQSQAMPTALREHFNMPGSSKWIQET